MTVDRFTRYLLQAALFERQAAGLLVAARRSIAAGELWRAREQLRHAEGPAAFAAAMLAHAGSGSVRQSLLNRR